MFSVFDYCECCGKYVRSFVRSGVVYCDLFHDVIGPDNEGPKVRNERAKFVRM